MAADNTRGMADPLYLAGAGVACFHSANAARALTDSYVEGTAFYCARHGTVRLLIDYTPGTEDYAELVVTGGEGLDPNTVPSTFRQALTFDAISAGVLRARKLKVRLYPADFTDGPPDRSYIDVSVAAGAWLNVKALGVGTITGSLLVTAVGGTGV